MRDIDIKRYADRFKNIQIQKIRMVQKRVSQWFRITHWNADEERYKDLDTEI